jgi:hypothetical protein
MFQFSCFNIGNFYCKNTCINHTCFGFTYSNLNHPIRLLITQGDQDKQVQNPLVCAAVARSSQKIANLNEQFRLTSVAILIKVSKLQTIFALPTNIRLGYKVFAGVAQVRPKSCHLESLLDLDQLQADPGSKLNQTNSRRLEEQIETMQGTLTEREGSIQLTSSIKVPCFMQLGFK